MFGGERPLFDGFRAGGDEVDQAQVGEEALGPVEEVGQRERGVLHQALHAVAVARHLGHLLSHADIDVVEPHFQLASH
mgnify:CR=1 FL=1